MPTAYGVDRRLPAPADSVPLHAMSKTVGEGGVRYPIRPVIAVGALVIWQDKVLLVRRRQPPNAGLWAIPGGAVQLGETLQTAAERELREETSITIRAGKPIYTFEHIDRDSDGQVRYHYVIVDLLGHYLAGEPKANSDALEARWISAPELTTLRVSEATLRFLRQQFPFATAANGGTP